MKPVILPHKGVLPTIAESAFIAPNATVIGDVHIGAESSIWYNVVVRGDSAHIRIGERTNIQDNSTVHVTYVNDDEIFATTIGNDILVGHNAVVHGATLEDGCFIGMKSCILDGAVVESGAMVAAGALVTPGKVVKAGQLWGGAPARKIRDLPEDAAKSFRKATDQYCDTARQHVADIQAFWAKDD